MKAPLSQTARALRRAFDQSFAETPSVARAAPFEDLLAIEVGGDPHALRLSEIAGVHSRRRIVPVPSGAPELVGMVSLRHNLAPIYDLRVLLGYPAAEPSGWLVLARGSEPIGFAFDCLVSYLRVPVTNVSPSSEVHPHHRGVVHADGVRPIIHLASLLEAIAQRVSSASKER